MHTTGMSNQLLSVTEVKGKGCRRNGPGVYTFFWIYIACFAHSLAFEAKRNVYTPAGCSCSHPMPPLSGMSYPRSEIYGGSAPMCPVPCALCPSLKSAQLRSASAHSAQSMRLLTARNLLAVAQQLTPLLCAKHFTRYVLQGNNSLLYSTEPQAT